MTRQQIFNKVATHLLTQNKRAVGPDGGCQYRTHDGLRCAVGALIPDGMYDIGMEGGVVELHHLRDESVVDSMCESTRDLWEALRLGGIDGDDDEVTSLLGDLQRVHDDYDPKAWRERLMVVCGKRKLYSDVLDAA